MNSGTSSGGQIPSTICRVCGTRGSRPFFTRIAVWKLFFRYAALLENPTTCFSWDGYRSTSFCGLTRLDIYSGEMEHFFVSGGWVFHEREKFLLLAAKGRDWFHLRPKCFDDLLWSLNQQIRWFRRKLLKTKPATRFISMHEISVFTRRATSLLHAEIASGRWSQWVHPAILSSVSLSTVLLCINSICLRSACERGNSSHDQTSRVAEPKDLS